MHWDCRTGLDNDTVNGDNFFDFLRASLIRNNMIPFNGTNPQSVGEVTTAGWHCSTLYPAVQPRPEPLEEAFKGYLSIQHKLWFHNGPDQDSSQVWISFQDIYKPYHCKLNLCT